MKVRTSGTLSVGAVTAVQAPPTADYAAGRRLTKLEIVSIPANTAAVHFGPTGVSAANSPLISPGANRTEGIDSRDADGPIPVLFLISASGTQTIRYLAEWTDLSQ